MITQNLQWDEMYTSVGDNYKNLHSLRAAFAWESFVL